MRHSRGPWRRAAPSPPPCRRGNGASFGIVTEFVVKLRDMPNDGIIRSAPILWGADKAKDVMTPWMERIVQSGRKETETLQFAFLHSPDGHPVCWGHDAYGESTVPQETFLSVAAGLISAACMSYPAP